jgi:hypothetical protein
MATSGFPQFASIVQWLLISYLTQGCEDTQWLETNRMLNKFELSQTFNPQ